MMDPEARARTYHRLQLRLSLSSLGLGAAYLGALIATGAAGRLAQALAALTPWWWLQLAGALLVLGGVFRLATLPLAWLGGFWLPRRFGLLHQPFGPWLLDAAKAAGLGAALGLAAAEIVYALLRATPWWWLWSALAFLGLSTLLTLVAPVWLVPLFYRLEPLPDASLRDRLLRLGEKAGVQRPHRAVVPIGGYEGPAVVGDTAHQDARRFAAAGRPITVLARASPSASSSVESGPCSRSHAAIPRRPASRRSRRAAVSAIQALTVVSSAAAAWSIAAARSGGREIDRFSRCAMRGTVAHVVGQGVLDRQRSMEPPAPTAHRGIPASGFGLSPTGVRQPVHDQ